jgi:hypothetical protein
MYAVIRIVFFSVKGWSGQDACCNVISLQRHTYPSWHYAYNKRCALQNWRHVPLSCRHTCRWYLIKCTGQENTSLLVIYVFLYLKNLSVYRKDTVKWMARLTEWTAESSTSWQVHWSSCAISTFRIVWPFRDNKGCGDQHTGSGGFHSSSMKILPSQVPWIFTTSYM